MIKITDTTVKEELNKSNSTFYDWKKRSPREVELIKKGLAAENILHNVLFQDVIKKENNKKDKR